MKKHSMTIVIVVTLLFAVAMIWWAKANQSVQTNNLSDSNIISMKGIHTHPQLEIYVKGVQQEIPNGVGLAGNHKPMHTHDDVPIVHLEFPAKVTEDDTRLGKFFEVWGKDFREFGQTVTMTVNGEPNNELENFQMKDGDKIVLNYE